MDCKACFDVEHSNIDAVIGCICLPVFRDNRCLCGISIFIVVCAFVTPFLLSLLPAVAAD